MTLQSNSIHIVASDLDGTLLAPNHQLSDNTKQTLKALHAKGYTFIFATGRHHVDVSGIRESVGIPAYMITSNGARVHDELDNLLYSQDLPEDKVQSVVDVLKTDPGLFIHLYQNEQWLLNKEDETLAKFHTDTGFTYQLFDADNAPNTGIAKIFVTDENRDHERLVLLEDALIAKFGDTLNIAFSTPWCLEVMAHDVSKGEALKAVAEKLGLGLENCIAFGDGMNDAEMLTMAGKGLVMENAHEKVKKALPNNEVIGTNADDAVAEYLKQHLISRG
ncbi:Cof-type HAD-IIB family hydrolase [Vibrio sp. 10N.261.51.F12]|uniref:Cof-type HAD-IIB family hydrolase n=1 Tax=Vibrio sp. 10N.261.51.F12 TaxID=3229679 RepID=UPI00354EDF69